MSGSAEAIESLNLADTISSRSEDSSAASCNGINAANIPLIRRSDEAGDELNEDFADRDSCDEDTANFHDADENENAGDKDEVDLSLEFQVPSDEVSNAIIQQIEFYFSDANIVKDNFLLKHVKRNKQGYVSLKLITSFRKIKKLTKDYRVVAHCLKNSQKLELNAEGTKVKRKDPLPEHDETVASRTVIAVNLPFEDPSVEAVAELFAKCGAIAFVRILKAGRNIPQDVKKYSNKHPELGKSTCAVVEFEQPASARKAEQTMTNTTDWRHGMRVAVLALPKKEKGGGDSKLTDQKSDDRLADNSNNGNGEGTSGKAKKSRSRKHKNSNRVDELSRDEDVHSGSGSEVEGADGSGSGNKGKRSSLSAPQSSLLGTATPSPRNTPKSSPKNSPMNSRRNQHHASHGRSPLAHESSPEMQRKNSGDSASLNPWIQRRLKAQQETSPLAGNSPAGSPKVTRKVTDAGQPAKMLGMDGVIRQPKGPDGTRGFAKGRGRPLKDAESG